MVVPGRERLDRPNVEDLGVGRRSRELGGLRLRADERPAVHLTIRSMLGGRGAEMPVDSAMKSVTSSCASAGLKRRSKPIVVDAFELIAFPHSEPATWPGIDLDTVAELDEPAEGVEEPLGALARIHREVRARRVSHEQGVARQHDPWILAARAVAHREAAVLGAVAGRVDAAQHDIAEDDLVAVLEWVVCVCGVRSGMHAHRDVVLEREPSVSRQVIGMRMCLDDTDDADLVPCRVVEILLDREGRIDHDRLSRLGSPTM